MTCGESISIGPGSIGPGTITRGSPALLVVAAPREAEAVMRGLGCAWRGLGCADSATRGFRRWEAIPARRGFELLVTGVGKACAAGAVATIFDPSRHSAVINLGVAGSLPTLDEGGEDGRNALRLLDVVVADLSVYADEGIETPDGFSDVASMGFPPAPPGFEAMGLRAPGDVGLIETLRPISDRVGPIATVSTCAGTDAIARRVVERTGAVAEAMEGAAVGFTALCVSASLDVPAIPFVEARVISNTTGDRNRQRWDLAGALDRLSGLTRDLAPALAG